MSRSEPEVVALRALLVTAVLVLVIGSALGFALAVPGALLLAGMALGVFVIARAAGKGLSGRAGSSTPPVRGFSRIESMEARGDYQGAAEAWRDTIAGEPGAIEPRVRLAELSLKHLNDAETAVRLYREARDLAEEPRRRLFYSLRVIDLYRDPLRDPGRVLVELRRLIDAYPDAPQAGGWRTELDRLLAERQVADG